MNTTNSEEFFSAPVMNAIDALIVVLDTEGTVVFTNDACQKLTGFEPNEVWGSPVWDSFIIEEEKEDTKAVFSSLITHEENNKHVNYWKTKYGNQKLISWSNTCLHDDEGKLKFIVATGIDITQQRKDQRTLEEREAKYQAIISSASECIISIDHHGLIDEVNPAVENIFGYKPQEILGKKISILMSEPDKSSYDRYISDYKKSRKRKSIEIGREITGLHKEGKTIPIYISFNVIKNHSKTLFVGIIHDLTKLREQEERLRRAHKLEAIGQLTGGIAHDFNNLLTIVLGNLEILESRNLGSNVDEILVDVLDVVDEGTKLVSQLLAFGKRQSLHPSNVDINDIIAQMSKLLSRTLREDIDIKANLQKKIWNCYVDSDQLNTSLLNIILNARDAMPNGGEINIKTNNIIFDKKNAQDFLDLEFGEYIEVVISDNGIGMPDNVLSKVFDPFFTTKKVGMGTGLGLSMVHGFIEQSQGKIYIDSIEGKGTKVSIYLPRSQNDVDRMQQDISFDTHFDGNGKRILHIEDDPKVRQVNTRRLMALGYDVLTAKDGPSGLKMLSEHKDIELILSDIVMPGGMNGIDLARKIKEQRPDIKILLTTGYSSEVLSLDFNEFQVLKKPYTKDDLAQKLNDISSP